jgi:hypothetical protein
MAEMKRLFTILSALSLLLFVAVALLWVRSYRVVEHWDAGQWIAASHDGNFQFIFGRGVESVLSEVSSGGGGYGRQSTSPREGETVGLKWWHWIWNGSTTRLHGAGFQYARRDLSVGNIVLVTIPHKWAAVVTMLPPLCWLFGQARRAQVVCGHCPRCGYDLRATPDRCPECGAVPRDA